MAKTTVSSFDADVQIAPDDAPAVAAPVAKKMGEKAKPATEAASATPAAEKVVKEKKEPKPDLLPFPDLDLEALKAKAKELNVDLDFAAVNAQKLGIETKQGLAVEEQTIYENLVKSYNLTMEALKPDTKAYKEVLAARTTAERNVNAAKLKVIDCNNKLEGIEKKYVRTAIDRATKPKGGGITKAPEEPGLHFDATTGALKVVDAPAGDLTEAEAALLADAEARFRDTIDRTKMTSLEQGQILCEIVGHSLTKAYPGGFGGYCAEVLQVDRVHAYRLMKYFLGNQMIAEQGRQQLRLEGKTVDENTEIIVPQSEAVFRILQTSGNIAEQAKVWEEAKSIAAEAGRTTPISPDVQAAKLKLAGLGVIKKTGILPPMGGDAAQASLLHWAKFTQEATYGGKIYVIRSLETPGGWTREMFIDGERVDKTFTTIKAGEAYAETLVEKGLDKSLTETEKGEQFIYVLKSTEGDMFTENQSHRLTDDEIESVYPEVHQVIGPFPDIDSAYEKTGLTRETEKIFA